MRPLGRTCLAGHLVITAPLTALLAPRGRLASPGPLREAHPLLAVSVLTTVLAVCAERAGSALLRQLTAAAKAANQELPRDHAGARAPSGQAERGLARAVGRGPLLGGHRSGPGPARSTAPGTRSAATPSRRGRHLGTRVIAAPAVRPRVDAMLAPVADVAHVAQVAAGRYARAAEEVGG